MKDKILSDYEMKRITKLYKQAQAYSDYKYDKIGKILDPILKNIEHYTNEQLQDMVDTMPPVSFYRAEIRAYINKYRNLKGENK